EDASYNANIKRDLNHRQGDEGERMAGRTTGNTRRAKPAGQARDRSTPDRTSARSRRVQSVHRAVALLRAVAAACGPDATATGLAAACGLNRATAWRILMTLEAHGLVVADRETGRYRIGFGLAELAGSVGIDALVQAAHPVLERLCLQTGETASLAVV